jgi:hypothetical protein
MKIPLIIAMYLFNSLHYSNRKLAITSLIMYRTSQELET